jgi:hypothetical protein
MKICPKCEEDMHVEEAKFCWQDGTLLVVSPPCDCGYAVTKYDIHCPVCGKKQPNPTTLIDLIEKGERAYEAKHPADLLADFRENSGHENDHFLEGEAQGTDIEDSMERNQ